MVLTSKGSDIQGTFHAQAENGLPRVGRERALPKLVAELPKLLRIWGGFRRNHYPENRHGFWEFPEVFQWGRC